MALAQSYRPGSATETEITAAYREESVSGVVNSDVLERRWLHWHYGRHFELKPLRTFEGTAGGPDTGPVPILSADVVR
jgi:hypothetical protein